MSHSALAAKAQFISLNPGLSSLLNSHFSSQNQITKKTIKKYLIKNSFFKTQIIKTSKGWVIKNPVQTIFSVTGNKIINDYSIKKIMRINDEDTLDINFHDKIINSIKKAYFEKGFQNVKIQTKIKKKKWKEWVDLKIIENKRTRIKSLDVQGFFSESADFYADFIKNNSTELIREGYYNKKGLEKGYANLLKYLKNQGFLKSKLYSERVSFENNWALISIGLNEGPLVYIKDILFQGSEGLTKKFLLSHMKSKINLPLNLKTLREDINTLEEIYKDHGFLDVKIKKQAVVTLDKSKNYGSINIIIQEGVRKKISQITVKGNDKIEQSFIKDLLKFQKGETLTQNKIDQSVQALSALGLFSRISIKTKETDPSEIVVSLQERKIRKLRGNVGLNTERGLTARLRGEYSHKNFFGPERSLFIKTRTQKSLFYKSSPFEYELSTIYEELFSPGQNIKGNVGLSVSKDIFNYYKNQISSVQKNKLSFSIYKKFNNYLDSYIYLWNFENREEDCSNPDACSNSLQQIGSSRISFKYDSRDYIFNPKSGVLFSTHMEYSSPSIGSSKNVQFFNISAQHQMYFSLKNYTLALNLKLGTIISQLSSIPVSRSFILGGQSSLRGYDGNIEGERIPSKTFVPINTPNDRLSFLKNNQVFKASSSQQVLSKVELRFPIVEDIKGLLFYDFGLVRLRSKNDSFIEFGHSAGVGFRYETLLIPVGIDLAYKLPPRNPELSGYRIHLSLGLF